MTGGASSKGTKGCAFDTVAMASEQLGATSQMATPDSAMPTLGPDDTAYGPGSSTEPTHGPGDSTELAPGPDDTAETTHGHDDTTEPAPGSDDTAETTTMPDGTTMPTTQSGVSSGMTTNVRVDVTAEKFAEICKFVQQNRPRALTEEERLDILRANAYLRHIHATDNVDVTREVASLLGRSRKTVQAVWREYIVDNAILPKCLPSNTSARSTRIPLTVGVISSVQRFVREKRQVGQRVVAKDVASFLLETSVLHYDPYVKIERESAVRLVQRFVKHCGYLRGSKNGKKSLALSERNILLRDTYVRFMCEATQQIHPATRRTVVYLDESFVHHHYNKNDISMYDPTDDLDVQPKSKHKGRRFCFIAAIVDGGPDNSKILCYEKFVGGKQTKDYHGMFDNSYFVDWFRRLLEALQDHAITNTIIVMDNAKYHKCIPDTTPKFTWRKADLIDVCDTLGIAYSPSELKATIWAKLQPYTSAVVPEVVELASHAGHEVKYSPPHHSDLQLIKLVWAIVKGNVGRQYDTNTSFHDVEQRLDAAFEGLTSQMVHGCIMKAESDLLAIHQHISPIDDDDYQDSSDSDNGDSGGSSESSDDEIVQAIRKAIEDTMWTDVSTCISKQRAIEIACRVWYQSTNQSPITNGFVCTGLCPPSLDKMLYLLSLFKPSADIGVNETWQKRVDSVRDHGLLLPPTKKRKSATRKTLTVSGKFITADYHNLLQAAAKPKRKKKATRQTENIVEDCVI
ncbi:hypothetical protein B5M09_008165 [Aphanomyces astaci]|uniref:Tc1-like transposase DDE domain-containing protein n=1 Tax=Aphanomyces astaci TaxID=112090 RepID=A0A3R7WIK6_APHAT|nr:hypothetical protein B5M09_008165 [Aphanomyces astaci]